MKSSEIISLVKQLAAVDVLVGDVECCTDVLQGLSRLISWAEAGKVSVAERLAELAAATPAIFPEHVVATATNVSLGQALDAAAAEPSQGPRMTFHRRPTVHLHARQGKPGARTLPAWMNP